MLSWTLGGYPSDNLLFAATYFFEQEGEKTSYDAFFHARYGDDWEKVQKAARAFSEAFSEFPFSCETLYNGPQNAGAANPLFEKPSGLTATMTCWSYDDLKSWCGPYPPQVLETQFEKVSNIWKEGLSFIEDIKPCAFCDMAYYGYTLFRSSYLQIRYILVRDDPQKEAEQKAILQEEIELAKLAHDIMRRNCSVGYEAANHYYVTKTMLKEKVLCCLKIADK